MRIFAGAAVAVATVVGLAGCGSSSENAAQPPKVEVGYNSADIRFSQAMIPHHQQTLRLVGVASRRSSNSELKLAGEPVVEAEASEIKTMSAWLQSWGVDNLSAPVSQIPGMLQDKDFTALEAMNGRDFDRQWLSSTEQHLRNGIQLAREVISAGKHRQTRDLARAIMVAQETMIKKMQGVQV